MLNKRYFKTVPQCEVTFRVAPEGANEVALLTAANNWEPIPMQKLKSGEFKVRVRLPLAQRIEFRYLVDDSRWINDEAADSYVPNEHGSVNSVVDTTP
ncbi:MAG: isoamylase early set domain-containing protein [Anaerolineae bacterium]|nr:isoamylase early set domain-containing protein [Anaerolineae bacterium]